MLAAAMVCAGVAATFSAWADIYHIASVDSESSHVVLALPVAAWLVWVRRARFRQCQPRGTWVGPVLMALGWGTSAWGFRHSAQSAFHLGAVVVVIGCLLSVVGRDILTRFLPAFVVLAFLVPMPGMVRTRVAMPLQTATAQTTQAIFDVLGEPVERSGNKLSINGRDVEVVEACNGMRLVFTLVLVSYAFAFGEPLKHYVRLIILVVSPASAILCNVIRLVPTVWMHGYWTPEWAGRFHDAAGWVMLVVAFLLLMGIIRALRWAMIPVQHYTLASQ